MSSAPTDGDRIAELLGIAERAASGLPAAAAEWELLSKHEREAVRWGKAAQSYAAAREGAKSRLARAAAGRLELHARREAGLALLRGAGVGRRDVERVRQSSRQADWAPGGLAAALDDVATAQENSS